MKEFIGFRPQSLRVIDVYRGEAYIGSLRKDGRDWHYHRKGDLVGTQLCRNPAYARHAVLVIEGEVV